MCVLTFCVETIAKFKQLHEVILPLRFLASLAFAQLSRKETDRCFHSENVARNVDCGEKACKVDQDRC